MTSQATLQLSAMPVPAAGRLGLALSCLSPRELGLFTKHRHARRRREFLVGRIALKRALVETQASALRISNLAFIPAALPERARSIEIVPDADGRLLLQREGNADSRAVSIAHAAGWAAAVCADRPVGIDVVDLDAPTGLPNDLPWFDACPAGWRERLRALVWGLRECALKARAVAARTVWDVPGIPVIPAISAPELIARWPDLHCCCVLEIDLDGKRAAGAFVPLSSSVALVLLLLPQILASHLEAVPSVEETAL